MATSHHHTVLALFLALTAALPAFAARPVVHHGPLTVSMRDGEGLPPARAKRTVAKPANTDRSRFDAKCGNNYEAALQAIGCREFLATYLPDEVSFGGVKFYLKLVADADAELALEDGAELREYRRVVDIAYLIVSVDRTAWNAAPDRFRKTLATMFMPMLRSLYTKASLYVTIYDGQTAVANSNWKPGARAPLVEMTRDPAPR